MYGYIAVILGKVFLDYISNPMIIVIIQNVWLSCLRRILYPPLYYIVRVAALPLPLSQTALRLALKVRLFGGMADLGIPGVFSTIGQNRQQRRPCGTSTPHTQSYQPIHRWTFLHTLYRERGSVSLFACLILQTISPSNVVRGVTSF